MKNYNVGNLPKWAQRRIELLERRIKELQKQVRDQANPGPTAIAVNEGFTGVETDYWAPDKARIKFWLPDTQPLAGATRRRFIEFRLRNGVVEAYASHCLIIRSQSGNVVSLETEAF